MIQPRKTLEGEKLMYREIARIQRSGIKMRILKALQLEKTPSQIAEKIGIHVSSASRSMRGLKKDKLIKCLNPSEPNYRYYQTTKKGKEVIQESDEYWAKISAEDELK